MDADAFLIASRPLDVTWDGTTDKFPSFIIALHICGTEAHWNNAALHGLLEVDRTNILTNYSNLTNVKITTAHITHTNAHATQNAK